MMGFARNAMEASAVSKQSKMLPPNIATENRKERMLVSKLRDLRLKKNMTVKQLSAALNIAANTIYIYESDSRQPGLDMAQRISDFFNVPLSELGWEYSAEEIKQKNDRKNKPPRRKKKLGSMDTPTAFVGNLLALMESSGMDTVRLSSHIGVSRSAISQWIHKKSFPRVDALESIAELFGVSVSALQSGSIENMQKTIPLYNDPQKDSLQVPFCDIADCAIRNDDPSLANLLPLGCIVLCSSKRPLRDGDLALCMNKAGARMLAFVYRPVPGQPIPGACSDDGQQCFSEDAAVCDKNAPNSTLTHTPCIASTGNAKGETDTNSAEKSGTRESSVVVLPCNRAQETLTLVAVAVEYRMPLNQHT